MQFLVVHHSCRVMDVSKSSDTIEMLCSTFSCHAERKQNAELGYWWAIFSNIAGRVRDYASLHGKDMPGIPQP